MASGDVRLAVRNVSKTFGGSRALDSVSLELLGGEIHALCGQNGSGKSTLIKILAAYHEPDPGAELVMDGESVSLPLTSGQPDKLGIRFVHQDLGLAADVSVLDNLFVEGYPTNALGLVRWRAARRTASAALARVNLKVPLDTRVEQLRPAQRAILAIARAMLDDEKVRPKTRVLILDEPTAQLPRPDVKRMMAAARAACDHGVAVLIVTHRMEEVLEYADRASVFRDGRLTATTLVADLTHDSLVELVLGRSLEDQYPGLQPQQGRSLFSLRGFSSGTAENVSMTINEGEIVGVTGLLGAGFEDLPYGIFAATAHTGELSMDGDVLHLSRPGQAMAAGMALVPAGRIGQSGVAGATLLENATLATLTRRKRGPFLNGRAERAFTAGVIARYDVRPAGSVDRPLAELSGGNQQKLLIAKWLESKPRLLLLHEPTQGVDIGSRRQLFELVSDAAVDGCAILLASADYADLAGLCHRVLVFSRGRIVSEIHGAALTEEAIAEACLRDVSTPAA